MIRRSESKATAFDSDSKICRTRLEARESDFRDFEDLTSTVEPKDHAMQ